MFKPYFIILSFSVWSISAFSQSENTKLFELNQLLVNTVMDDVYNPPIASRIYCYPNIAFYECMEKDGKNFSSIYEKLNNNFGLPRPPAKYAASIAAAAAFSYVAQSLIGSEYRFVDWRKNYEDSLLQTEDATMTKASFQFGKAVADSIIAFSKRDNYLRSRGYSRYTVTNKLGDWQPTPLDYAQALEPNWIMVRPLLIQRANQFKSKHPLVFSKSKQSVFWKTLIESYNICEKLDSTQKNIALYWDDNPNTSKNIGHLNYFEHKISPGGHWLIIAVQTCQQQKLSEIKSAQVCAATTVAIFDAFIACWEEKFRTNLIRPITVINRYVNKNWSPLIQTPPFPEFTSGHSVTSNAAATVLTGLIGDNIPFLDETEVPFGLGKRNFSSFLAAAKESSMSRVYGGIHYIYTAKLSEIQGAQIGKYVLQKIK